jgi:hypothetical protein
MEPDLTNDAGESTSSSIHNVLEQRDTQYGKCEDLASLSQALSQTVIQHYFKTHGGQEAPPLPPFMVETLQMICHKLSRIANGDPMYIESWRDISGYAELVCTTLKDTPGASDAIVQPTKNVNGNWVDVPN